MDKTHRLIRTKSLTTNRVSWNFLSKALVILSLSAAANCLSYGQLKPLSSNEFNTNAAVNRCFGGATTGDAGLINKNLSSLPASQLPGVLDQIAPTIHPHLSNFVIGNNVALGQLLEQRFSAVRLGERGLASAVLEGPVLIEDTSNQGKSFKEAKEALLQAPENRWSTWVQGYGFFGRSFSPNARRNNESRSVNGEVLGGADYQWFEGLKTGGYAGYSGTYLKFNGGGRGVLNGTDFGLYVNYDLPGTGFYADGVVGGGYQNYSVNRPIQFGSINRVAQSRTDGGDVMTMIVTGYDVEIWNFTFGPVASMQYTYAGANGFTEHGAGDLNLRVGRQNVNSIRTHFGGRIAYTWKVANNIFIIPEGRMLWQHEYLENPRTITANLDSGSCPTFTFATGTVARNAALASAGLVLQLGQHVNLNAYYTADFGKQDFSGHIINGGVTVAF